MRKPFRDYTARIKTPDGYVETHIVMARDKSEALKLVRRSYREDIRPPFWKFEDCNLKWIKTKMVRANATDRS